MKPIVKGLCVNSCDLILLPSLYYKVLFEEHFRVLVESTTVWIWSESSFCNLCWEPVIPDTQVSDGKQERKGKRLAK